MCLGMSFLLQPSVPDGSNFATQEERKLYIGLSPAVASAAGPTWIGAAFMAGWAVDAAGVLGTDFLDDVTPVPAGSFYDGGFARSAAGLRYVAAWPASGLVVYEGKIARRRDGAMCIATAGTAVEPRAGWALTFRGEVLATTAAPELVKDGVGLRQNGFVCMSEVT